MDRNRMMRKPPRVEESSLKHVSFLGRGSFGCVSLQRDSNFRLYAKKSSSSFNQVKDFNKEVRIMLRFRNHPRIVQALSSFVHLSAPPDAEGCHIYMEYASKGTLFNMISRFRGRPMPENMIGRAAFMILQGLEILHSNGYVHCDLKPANVLVFPSTTVGEPWCWIWVSPSFNRLSYRPTIETVTPKTQEGRPTKAHLSGRLSS
ncbi:PREDICTED: putative cyclin-dependent kinase F-2 [Camelina sativa]|uniref:Cyclin-dependent kinase F-2 n=1 Tax=Camelina sativa TaxID=90675 RepID=A0ABM0WAV6_CAMSA|nr:PREDICTED: putative cyclin-dependent kinase F-2 [Camelina sativa]